MGLRSTIPLSVVVVGTFGHVAPPLSLSLFLSLTVSFSISPPLSFSIAVGPLSFSVSLSRSLSLLSGHSRRCPVIFPLGGGRTERESGGLIKRENESNKDRERDTEFPSMTSGTRE